MNRLTQTPLEKEIMIGMSKIDKIFNDCIKDLDEMAKQYMPKQKNDMEIMSKHNGNVGENLLLQLAAMQNQSSQFGGLGLGQFQNSYSQLDLAIMGLNHHHYRGY